MHDCEHTRVCISRQEYHEAYGERDIPGYNVHAHRQHKEEDGSMVTAFFCTPKRFFWSISTSRSRMVRQPFMISLCVNEREHVQMHAWVHKRRYICAVACSYVCERARTSPRVDWVLYFHTGKRACAHTPMSMIIDTRSYAHTARHVHTHTHIREGWHIYTRQSR